MATEENVFRKLALRLDGLPNRFPPTESGAEIRLLRKLFLPEEAAIANIMHLEAATASEIAANASADFKETRDHLKRMAAKGLIDVRKGDGEFTYALRPFVVGFYEGQLPRMDAEMAMLFEEYFKETRGGILRDGPAHHRVIPVGRAIPLQVEIHPYERATELLENAQSWGVRDCICRKQRHLVGKGCDHRMESCLVFAPVKNAFDRSKVDRAISKEKALSILRETEEAGLVHSSGNYQDGLEYICNCCTCCCGIMRGIAEYGILSAVAHSDFVIDVEEALCSGCGDCLERCQFQVLSVPDKVVVADLKRCVGCGLCVLVCPTDGLHLKRRADDEVLVPPADIKEWRAQRSGGRANKKPGC